MHEKNVVVVGGGSGTNAALMGLKRYTSRLTALISTFDHPKAERGSDGAGNGVEHPSEEVRNSLLALSADATTTDIMERLFAYRFSPSPDLGPFTFGNIFLAALADITGGADLALQAAARVLNVNGQVLPVTLHETHLLAEMNDGDERAVRSVAELVEAASQVGLRRVRLEPRAPALNAALQAVRDADIVVLGPSDLHFGILAPLMLDGMAEALAASNAVKIFVCNLMTQAHTTQGWPASRFVRTVLNYAGGPSALDCVIINSAPLDPELALARARHGEYAVRFDLDECLALGPNVIVRPVASEQALLHDPEKLARTVLFLGGGRSGRRVQTAPLFAAGLDNLVPARNLSPKLAEP